MVEMRCQVPLLIVDAYWDHRGQALCPAATGISHHIGPNGDIEFCPPVQFADANIADSGDLEEIIASSLLLKELRQFATATTRGCILRHPAPCAIFCNNKMPATAADATQPWPSWRQWGDWCCHHLPARKSRKNIGPIAWLKNMVFWLWRLWLETKS